MRRSLAIRSALVTAVFTFLPLAPVLAEDEGLVGAYSVSLTEGARTKTGTATVKYELKDFEYLVLELKLGTATITGRALLDPWSSDEPEGMREFEVDVPAGSPARTLELKPTKTLSATGVLKEGTKAVGKATFTRQRAVLIVHSIAWEQSHTDFFRLKALEVARYYLNKGYKRRDTFLGLSWDDVIKQLDLAQSEGRPYDRFVIIGHGGWDGPIIYGPGSSGPWQISGEMNADKFEDVAGAVRRGTTRRARIYISACHPGGSDRFERKDETNSDYVYVDDLAKRAKRWVAGPSGVTSNENALKGVQGGIEQERGVHQEMRVATEAGGKSFNPGAWVTGVPAAANH